MHLGTHVCVNLCSLHDKAMTAVAITYINSTFALIFSKRTMLRNKKQVASLKINSLPLGTAG